MAEIQPQHPLPRLRLRVQRQLGGHPRVRHVVFFGIGDHSRKATQTDYRLRDLDAVGFATLRATPWLSVTGRAGWLRSVDIGRGTSSIIPSTGDRFDEITAPSLTRQPSYVHADVAVEADTRDVPGYPAHGGRYRLSVSTFHDRELSRYSFRRVEAEAAQYMPLLHERSVLALRGRMNLSQTDAGQEVPFYLLPALGGQNSLRGYLDYRFRDRDLLLLGAEYRWPMFRAVDGAVFYDAGTVAPTASALSTHHLSTDYGVGFRVHSARHLLCRFDVARGQEGTRVSLTFKAPLAFSKRLVVPYVP